MTSKSVGIIGSGAWGCALAHAFSIAGNEVMLWGRSTETVNEINESHENNTKSTWASFLILKCVVLLSPSNQLGFKQSNHVLLKIIQNASLLSKQLQQS